MHFCYFCDNYLYVFVFQCLYIPLVFLNITGSDITIQTNIGYKCMYQLSYNQPSLAITMYIVYILILCKQKDELSKIKDHNTIHKKDCLSVLAEISTHLF